MIAPHRTKLIQGKNLQPGDTVDVLWGNGRDTIVSMRPYTGPIAELADARVASFVHNERGMTITAGALFEVFHRQHAAA